MENSTEKLFSRTLLIFGVCVLLLGCNLLWRTNFINHIEPVADLNLSVFEDAGCPLNQWGRGECRDGSPIRGFGCPRIIAPSPHLGNLEPDHPIVYCVYYRSDQNNVTEEQRIDWENGGFIKEDIGLNPQYFRFLIERDGEFVLIRDEDNFRKIFAPVESPNEALGYALALTNLEAAYGLEFDPDLEYFASEIEDTHVKTVDDGYDVHLFKFSRIGCGPHPTASVVVRVNRDGSLEIGKRENVFKDPSDDNVCID